MTFISRWLIYALLSALFASLVGIFAKVGMKDVDSNLATAIRSVVMSLLLISICSAMGLWSKLASLHRMAVGMIVLSGIAGSLSWLFYFKAIQSGSVSQVAPIDKLSMPIAVILAVILLKDRPSAINWLGVAFITLGGLLAAMPRAE
jgi:transporter family protein